MDLTVGTFNLNNLFTRWNFRATAPTNTDLPKVAQTLTYEYAPDNDLVRLRTFKGRLVKPKSATSTEEVAARVQSMDLDVLAVQEAENIEALTEFNRDALGGLYPHVVLIEGNDQRLIDVGLLSKLPVRRIMSHQAEPDPADTSRRIFGRDLLQVDIYNPAGTSRIFTIFNTHMKSNFVPWERDQTPADIAAAEQANHARRARQAEVTRHVIERETRPDSRYVVLGDMNDDPDSPHLAPLVTDGPLGLVDALANVQETRPPKAEDDEQPPADGRWTSRHRADGVTQFRLFDQIWVSPALGDKFTGPMIDRRTKHGGNGSDHDPAWITLTDL